MGRNTTLIIYTVSTNDDVGLTQTIGPTRHSLPLVERERKFWKYFVHRKAAKVGYFPLICWFHSFLSSSSYYFVVVLTAPSSYWISRPCLYFKCDATHKQLENLCWRKTQQVCVFVIFSFSSKNYFFIIFNRREGKEKVIKTNTQFPEQSFIERWMLFRLDLISPKQSAT